MPRPDPLPPPLPKPVGPRFKRAMRWISAVAVAVAATCVLLVMRGDSHLPIHMLIATALGTGLSVLLAGALMTLIFLSNSSGHDAAAGARPDSVNKDIP